VRPVLSLLLGSLIASCGLPFWTPRPDPLERLVGPGSLLTGAWDLTFMLDSVRHPEAEHDHRPVWTTTSSAVPWLHGSIVISDSARNTSDGRLIYATLRLWDEAGTAAHLAGYLGDDIQLFWEQHGDSLDLSFTPNVADAGVGAVGRFFGDSVIGSWTDDSYGGALHGGRFRMVRHPVRT
jgi:hypothetical protein